MVVVHHEPIKATGVSTRRLQPVGPFLVLEYVSKYNKRKDYEISYEKYEKELRVPYYLLFYPDADEMSLFHLVAGKYHAVRPNDVGRGTQFPNSNWRLRSSIAGCDTGSAVNSCLYLATCSGN